jgi:hypothetical protein
MCLNVELSRWILSALNSQYHGLLLKKSVLSLPYLQIICVFKLLFVCDIISLSDFIDNKVSDF